MCKRIDVCFVSNFIEWYTLPTVTTKRYRRTAREAQTNFVYLVCDCDSLSAEKANGPLTDCVSRNQFARLYLVCVSVCIVYLHLWFRKLVNNEMNVFMFMSIYDFLLSVIHFLRYGRSCARTVEYTSAEFLFYCISWAMAMAYGRMCERWMFLFHSQYVARSRFYYCVSGDYYYFWK